MGGELCLLAWSGKICSCFLAYSSGSTSTLLPRYAQVGWECTVPKPAGFPKTMLKWQVLSWRAVGVVSVPLCAAPCWVVQVALCRVYEGVPKMDALEQPVHTPSEQGLALMERMDS